MKQTFAITLGLPLSWEGEVLDILNQYERRYSSRLPKGEITSRALQKLTKATVTCHAHLGVLLHRIVHHVLIDYGKEQSRHYRHHVYDYAFDFPADDNAVASRVVDELEEIFHGTSPLDDDERLLLKSMLEDPAHFMRLDGSPQQSALGQHFKESHTTIGRRWHRIVQKIRAFHPSPDIDAA